MAFRRGLMSATRRNLRLLVDSSTSVAQTAIEKVPKPVPKPDEDIICETIDSDSEKVDDQPTTSAKKHFCCELCNVRLPYTNEILKEHLESRDHKCMKMLHDYGLWPGDPKKATVKQLTPRTFSFHVNKPGVIYCLVCKGILSFSGAKELVEHQMRPMHRQEASKHGRPNTLYYCNLCDVKSGINCLEGHQKHLNSGQHLVNTAEQRILSKSKAATLASPKPEAPLDISRVRAMQEQKVRQFLRGEAPTDAPPDPPQPDSIALLQQLLENRKKQGQASQESSKPEEKAPEKKAATVPAWEEPRALWVWDPENPIDRRFVMDYEGYFLQLSAMLDAKEEIVKEKKMQLEAAEQQQMQMLKERDDEHYVEELMDDPEAIERLMQMARNQGFVEERSRDEEDQWEDRRWPAEDRSPEDRSRRRRSRSRSKDRDRGVAARVLVDNLPEKSDSAEVKRMLSRYGEIYEFSMPRDKRNRCYGYVELTYSNKRDAQDAVHMLHGYKFKGSPLKVKIVT